MYLESRGLWAMSWGLSLSLDPLPPPSHLAQTPPPPEASDLILPLSHSVEETFLSALGLFSPDPDHANVSSVSL
jgi:hypothetical protein